MNAPLDISFVHDYDTCLYMLSKDPEARTWTVIVHCAGGKTRTPELDEFIAYPGCTTHEGEAAWNMEYIEPETIEIRRPGCEPVFIRHPEAETGKGS